MSRNKVAERLPKPGRVQIAKSRQRQPESKGREGVNLEAGGSSRQSEGDYRSLFNLIDDAFCIVEVLFGEDGQAKDYRFLEVNAAFERHTGLAGAVGKRIREMVPNQDDHWFEIYGRVALTGEPKRFAIRGEALGRFFEAYAVRLGDPQDRKVAVLFRDETERKKAEEELGRSEERFKLAMEGAGVGLWDWDIRTGRVYYSPRWKGLFGYEEHEIGESWEDWVRLLHPDERAWVSRLQEDFLAGTGKTITLEYRLRHKDGAYRWIEASAVVVRDENGQACRLVGSHGDITARKRAEEALRGSEERFRAVLENMSEGVMLFDKEQNLIYQNAASLRIHGFNRAEEGQINHVQLPVTWKAWDKTGRPISFDDWPVSRVFRSERFAGQVLRVVRVETGQEFFGSYNGSPILDANGTLSLGFITIRDITEEFRAQTRCNLASGGCERSLIQTWWARFTGPWTGRSPLRMTSFCELWATVAKRS